MSPPISTGEPISLEAEANTATQIETSVPIPVATPIAIPIAAHATIPIASPIAIPIAAPIATPIAKPKSQKDRIKRKANKESQAPNRIINWENLKHVVNANLGSCKTCKNSTLRLAQKKLVGFAATMEIVCDSCEIGNKRLYDSIRYNEKMLHESVIKNVGDRKEYHKKRQALNNQKRKYKHTIEALNKNDRVHPTPNKKFRSRSKNPKGNTLDFAINIKAMLTAFYLGTGGLDVGGYASFFWITCWQRLGTIIS